MRSLQLIKGAHILIQFFLHVKNDVLVSFIHFFKQDLAGRNVTVFFQSRY